MTPVGNSASGWDLSSSPAVKIKMLEQMAEALEDQVGALYRRAAAFEEEEFLLNREVEERQTEINRLRLKLDGMRAERDRLIERIELISAEAATIREEVFSGQDEVALAAIDDSRFEASNSTQVW
jgi:predicted RNase H-like nuclease (RuvC/YqgF family)